MNKALLKSIAVLFFSLFVVSTSFSQADPVAGEALFKGKCASCHNKGMKANSTGPALGGVEERWAEYPKEDLYAWIRNSSKSIQSGQPRAVELESWAPSVMTAFESLSDADLENLLLYINNVYEFGCATGDCEVAVATSEGGTAVEEQSNTPFFIVLSIFLLILVLVLGRIIQNVKRIDAVEAGLEAEKPSLLKLIFSKQLLAVAVFSLVVIGGYLTVNGAINLNRQQGYQPEQPIEFSHKLHAGVNEIPCEFCHDGARRSKHSVIPATSTCMSCHKAIKYRNEYEEISGKKLESKKEIAKIYASAGYDPTKGDYVDVTKYSADAVKVLFASYLMEDKVKANPALIKEDSASLYNQIGENYLNELVGMFGKSIEWKRIHNLPDHVYFSHEQHVTVGKIECQDCHGPIEDMEVVEQHAPLSMGWCINCHRETEVQFGKNDYYNSDNYTEYHDELVKGERKNVTVEDIGGLECQKCHY